MSEIYKNKQLVNAKSRAKEHSDKTCAESSTENATNIQQFIWAIGPNQGIITCKGISEKV